MLTRASTRAVGQFGHGQALPGFDEPALRRGRERKLRIGDCHITRMVWAAMAESRFAGINALPTPHAFDSTQTFHSRLAADDDE